MNKFWGYNDGKKVFVNIKKSDELGDEVLKFFGILRENNESDFVEAWLTGKILLFNP